MNLLECGKKRKERSDKAFFFFSLACVLFMALRIIHCILRVLAHLSINLLFWLILPALPFSSFYLNRKSFFVSSSPTPAMLLTRFGICL